MLLPPREGFHFVNKHMTQAHIATLQQLYRFVIFQNSSI